jgi:hypothetical protein
MIDTNMFKVSYAADAVKESGVGGNFIGESGVYDVVIKFASLEQTTNGAGQLNLNIEYNGNQQTIYGPIVLKKDGTPNQIGARMLNKLLTIAGVAAGTAPTLEEETHNVGKENKPKAFQVFTDLSDVELKIKLRQVYSKYNSQVRSNMELDSAFRLDDGASSSEIASEAQGTEVVIGSQLKDILEKEATTQPKYDDSVTPEEVAAWIAAGRPKAGSASNGQQAAPAANVFAGGGQQAAAPAAAFPGT